MTTKGEGGAVTDKDDDDDDDDEQRQSKNAALLHLHVVPNFLRHYGGAGEAEMEWRLVRR